MRHRIAVGIACVAFSLAGLVVTDAGAATKTVGASGGSVTFSATVRNARTCTWVSSPGIARFDATVKCATGRIVRTAKFKANTVTTAKNYAITLVVSGTTTKVDRWRVSQAGRTPPTTTTTTVAPTTTTTSTTTSTPTSTTTTTTTTVPPTTTTTSTPTSTTTTTTTTVPPTPYFDVTSLLFQYPGTLRVFLTFQNISNMTITDNVGDICTYVAESFSGGASEVDCGLPNALAIVGGQTKSVITSLTVASPGLPSETFSWPHLFPTVTAVSDGTNLTTFTISGTFTATEQTSSGLIGGVIVDVGSGGRCTMEVTTLSAVSCQANVSLAAAESSGIGLSWSMCIYTFDSAQGTPVSDSSAASTDSYDATTNSWF